MNERRKTAPIFGYSHRHDAALTLCIAERGGTVTVAAHVERLKGRKTQ